MKIYNIKSKLAGIMTAAILLGFTACDPLGLEPNNKVGEDQFWLNPQLSRAYVNNFYLWAPATANDVYVSEQWSDNAIGNDEQDWDTYRKTNFTHRYYDPITSLTGFSTPWSGQYKNIRAVNMGIERIGSSTVLEEDVKEQLLAECYFFRAWLYFELEQYWGAVPYVDKTLTINDETMIPRAKREELFDYILKDLDTSIEYFKNSGVKPTLGLVNESAVEVFKSRVALYAACASDASKNGTFEKLNASDESKALFRFTKTSESYYQIALTAAGNVIGKYSLDPDYNNLFNSEGAHKSVESIWPMMFNETNRKGFNPAAKNGPDGYYYGATSKASPSWDCRGAVFPSQDLVDCYYQKDEADGKWKQWWKTKQSVADMKVTVDADENVKATTADYHKMYENRDKRFYATILYDGSYYGPKTENDMYLIGTWIDNSRPSETEKYSALHTGFRNTIRLQAPANRASAQTVTGYYPCKYTQYRFLEDGQMNKKQPSNCFFMIRYAEALLNYAEAAIKLGREGEALSKINEIRNRAGLDNFDQATVGHGLWEEYQLQRRVEFAYEVPGHRYYDLLRWNEAEGNSTIKELNRPPKAMLIFRKGIESEKLGENGYPVQPNENGYFVPHFETKRLEFDFWDKKFDNARYYFMPFSETMITSYKGLLQNPGWQDFVYER